MHIASRAYFLVFITSEWGWCLQLSRKRAAKLVQWSSSTNDMWMCVCGYLWVINWVKHSLPVFEAILISCQTVYLTELREAVHTQTDTTNGLLDHFFLLFSLICTDRFYHHFNGIYPFVTAFWICKTIILLLFSPKCGCAHEQQQPKKSIEQRQRERLSVRWTQKLNENAKCVEYFKAKTLTLTANCLAFIVRSINCVHSKRRVFWFYIENEWMLCLEQ